MDKNEIAGSNIAIWGTKVMGNAAFYYYKDRCNIVCYIDNNEQKWGKKLNGVEICPPDVLKKIKADVVLAMKYGIEAVRQQLYEEFNISTVVLFQVQEKLCMAGENPSTDEEIEDDSCIVSFSGGLGNQMFQYALLRSLEVQGKTVLADVEKYARLGVMEFQLTDVFKNINLNICTKEQKTKLIEKNTEDGNKRKKFVIYFETAAYEPDRKKKADLSLLDITGGVIVGKHQTYQFAERIREILLSDFSFHTICDKQLERLQNVISHENAISVHIRRGDYLLEQNKWSYGNICTLEYYECAMQYIRDRVSDCTFYFFSDDIEWVKKQYDVENAVYIEESMFDDYRDWYDMYLMSICRHNIIANSTFSWWGAWLNQNKEKIVIAPKKWIHTYDYEDIYPSQWVQI